MDWDAWRPIVLGLWLGLLSVYGRQFFRFLSKLYYGSEEGSPHAKPLPKEPRWPRPSGLRELPAMLFGRQPHKPSGRSEKPGVAINPARKRIGSSGPAESESVNRRLTGPTVGGGPST